MTASVSSWILQGQKYHNKSGGGGGGGGGAGGRYVPQCTNNTIIYV